MLKRKRSLSASVFVLLIIGSIGFSDLMEKPRFQAFHTVDVLQLIATGMCYGFALAIILVLLQGVRTE